MKGGISYTELGGLDTFEFFVLLANYDEQVTLEKSSKDASKLRNKRKRTKIS